MKEPKKDLEEKPQKGFEEFAIDPSVLDELDNIEEETKEEEPIKEEGTIEVVEEKKNQVIDASSSEFINIVRDNIDFCTQEIKEVSETMDKIENQKGGESFWKKGENIKTISKYVNKVSEVQQKTLDLLVMFLGASGKMADDYDTILQTIDELGEVNGGEAEVLDYLLKVKRMIKEIKNNDERLKEIIFDIKTHAKQIEILEKEYKEKTEDFDRNSKIAKSKIARLTGKTNRLSFFLLITYILIAAIGVIIYLKLYK